MTWQKRKSDLYNKQSKQTFYTPHFKQNFTNIIDYLDFKVINNRYRKIAINLMVHSFFFPLVEIFIFKFENFVLEKKVVGLFKSWIPIYLSIEILYI